MMNRANRISGGAERTPIPATLLTDHARQTAIVLILLIKGHWPPINDRARSRPRPRRQDRHGHRRRYKKPRSFLMPASSWRPDLRPTHDLALWSARERQEGDPRSSIARWTCLRVSENLASLSSVSPQ